MQRSVGKKWQLLININLISSTKEMNLITRESVSKLVTQPSFRAVGQRSTKCQTFAKKKRKKRKERRKEGKKKERKKTKNRDKWQ